MNTKPLSPTEALDHKGLPNDVISIINELLVKKLRRNNGWVTATIKQREYVDALQEKFQEKNFQNFLDEGWLDFEPVFEQSGWNISYFKPDRDETFEAYWEFKAKISSK